MSKPLFLKLALVFIAVLTVAMVIWWGLGYIAGHPRFEFRDPHEAQFLESKKESVRDKPAVEQLPLEEPPNVWLQEKVPDIDTSNWKTYRNEEYGFQVQYPSTWIADEDFATRYPTGFKNMIVALISPVTADLVEEGYPIGRQEYEADIHIYVYQRNQKLGDHNLLSYLQNHPEISDVGEIKFNGYSAYEAWHGGLSKSYFIILEANGLVYKIFMPQTHDRSDISNTEMKLLSTFKLLE